MIDNLIFFFGSIATIFFAGFVLYFLFALVHLPRYFKDK